MATVFPGFAIRGLDLGLIHIVYLDLLFEIHIKIILQPATVNSMDNMYLPQRRGLVGDVVFILLVVVIVVATFHVLVTQVSVAVPSASLLHNHNVNSNDFTNIISVFIAKEKIICCNNQYKKLLIFFQVYIRLKVNENKKILKTLMTS